MNYSNKISGNSIEILLFSGNWIRIIMWEKVTYFESAPKPN